jgi:hypothetical protein
MVIQNLVKASLSLIFNMMLFGILPAKSKGNGSRANPEDYFCCRQV